MERIFRYEDGVWPNVAATAYAFVGYALGVWLMTRPEWLLDALAVVLTAHALVTSAYLLHECAHGAVFAKPEANDRLGAALSWLSGACVASYAGIKEKHLRHHADRLDVVTFDYRAVLRRAPSWARRAVLALEWAQIPAVESLMRGLVLKTALADRGPDARRRVIAIVAVRVAVFAALAWISVKAILLYAVAYILFVHVLRFLDAFQHTFDVYVSPTLTPAPVDPRRDRQYEHDNTYSNLVSRSPLWNLLVLNFPYHNAHHAKPAAPWYRLPALHASLYGDHDAQVITCREPFSSYGRHRVARVLADDYGEVKPDGDRVGGFLGAVGVSFLTAV